MARKRSLIDRLAARVLSPNGNGGSAGYAGDQSLGDLPGAKPATEHQDQWEQPIALGQMTSPMVFPLETLPEELARFVVDVAYALNSPPDYIAIPLLVLAGSAIGSTRALEIKQGWREYPSLFAAVVGSPGSAKSPALGVVARPVYAEQARLSEIYARAKATWEEREEQTTPPPRLRSVYVGDITTEKLAAVLRDNPRGLGMIRDELTAWILAMDAYRSGRGADRQHYLSLWAGATLRIDRKSEAEPIIVRYPFVGICGGLPPAMLPTLKGHRDLWDGFLDRLLLSYPTQLPAKAEDWMAADPVIAEAWPKTLTGLWSLEHEEGDGDPRPRCVHLTGDGRRAWVGFTGWLASEMNNEEVPDALKGHLSKFKGYGARLALVLHYLRTVGMGLPEENEVDGITVHQAHKLVSYFYAHARRVHDALGTDEETDDARRVLAWITRHRPEQFKRYDAHEGLKGQKRFGKIEALDRPLDRLERHGYIRRLERPKPTNGPGRPPVPVYAVNPLLYQRPVNSENPENEESP